MILYPAVDILGGRCVRLEQGDFDRATEYSGDPAEQAKIWENCGASFIHVVDLDGARGGAGRNGAAIKRITEAVAVPVQIGGGVRSMDDVERHVKVGISRVIIGTAAVRNPDFVREAVKEYGDRIAVGVDSKDGYAAVEGWGEVSNLASEELCVRMRDAGVRTVIHTDIAQDGMMAGPNLASTKKIIDLGGLDVIASGGVSTISDLCAARDIGASGAVIGRALYNKTIDLAEAVKIFEGSRT
jgi:phosphoribosylformimino-5-aminoimidazole carboxamide ribotide isomerase